LAALKVGVHALRHAQGRVDVDRIRVESNRILTDLRENLDAHRAGVTSQVTQILTDYFDPRSGRLNERLTRLIERDGELEQLIRKQVDGDASALARTLADHVGDQSPLQKLLNPESSQGLVRYLTTALERELGLQRESILREFSLDNKQGALARFMCELAAKNGQIGEALEDCVGHMVSEFSLDRAGSALSRLISRFESAQQQLTAEFSLDREESALARLRREILNAASEQRENSEVFQREVLAKLAELATRRREALRTTQHGQDFERALYEMIQSLAQNCGDVACRTGTTTGFVRQCKRGDVVIQIGVDHAAAGSAIVIEAKEDASYSLKAALTDLELARKNRGAEIGVFVFSARTSPEGLEPFARYGNDLVIVWNADDPTSDITVTAALSVAKALCTRARIHCDEASADFTAIHRSILEIERQFGGLDEIAKCADSARSGIERIVTRARIMREAIAKQLCELHEGVDTLEDLATVTHVV
jgi:hypothetical protein